MNITYSIKQGNSSYSLGSFNILEPKIIDLWNKTRLSNMRLDHLHMEHIESFMSEHNLEFNYSAHVKELVSKRPLPQTDFTRKIEVTAYDAKMFIGRIETQIEILEMVNKPDEAKHWRTLSDHAHKLFNIPVNGTDREVQRRIEEAYNKQENGKV